MAPLGKVFTYHRLQWLCASTAIPQEQSWDSFNSRAGLCNLRSNQPEGKAPALAVPSSQLLSSIHRSACVATIEYENGDHFKWVSRTEPNVHGRCEGDWRGTNQRATC